jgi:hypothetical protein
MRSAAAIGIASVLASLVLSAATPVWRQATEAELKEIIPARAPVEKEHIETEMRTASGITDGSGKFIAGAVLITAGYSADGKYSHFLVVQAPLKVAGFSLPPGEYLLGFKHEGDAMRVSIYEAQSGRIVGSVRAERQSRLGRIESFHIFPPPDHAMIAIGRFGFPFEIDK